MKIFRIQKLKAAVTDKGYFLYILFFWVLFMVSCRDSTSGAVEPEKSTSTIASKNILLKISEDNLVDLNWMNAPEKAEINDGKLTITAKGQTDFFINPADMKVSASAPFLFKEVIGDFVALARVTPDLSAQWNAAALMVVLNETNWIKFGFENSDATGPGIVSVVTRGTSDDANGPVLKNIEGIWLKLVRKDQNYSMHWSYDGHQYFMARLTAMPETDSIKVGVEAQCPDGTQAVHRFEHFSIESVTVEDIRKGE